MATDKDPQIAAKLHPEHDKDLIERIKKIPRRERSYVYREAMREYFRRLDEKERS